MPRGDGTGPRGSGPGQGRGRGAGQGGVGFGGAGPGGECVCPSCGVNAPHRQGVPCSTVKCPKCGTAMVRGQ